MTANELRIGNLVNFRIGTPQQFQGEMTAAQFFKLSEVIKGVDALTYFGISAIPLTEEWILKFGFELFDYETDDDSDFIYKDYKILLKGRKLFYHICSAPDDIWDFCIKVEFSESVLLSSIKYVHELQNLYFALTGSELIA